ncbi:MAG: hypothetical protein ACI31X_01655 [Lactobacillus amylovorus]
MAVFANEGNVSQDANFRRHLDDNWDSGNREFDKVEGLLNTLEEKINGYQIDALIDRINELNETIEEQDARISKLEDAVFNTVYINDTKSDVETKPSITHEINDTHVVNDDNGIIIQDEHQTLPNDVN